MDFAALSSALIAAEEEHHLRDIGIHPYAVGAIALALLVLVLLALLVFGQGREHS